MVCVFSVWAGSSAWLGVLTLRIERPPYTRKPSRRAVGSGVQISPGPPDYLWLPSSSLRLSSQRRACFEGFAWSKFLVLWLVQLHLDISRHLEVCHQTEAFIADARGELNATRLQFFNCLLYVIAIEGN